MPHAEVSILDSIKKKLGVGADYDVFDLDIMTHINSAFLNLNQLGIGPAEGFEIEGPEETWDTFLGANASPLFNAVKSFIFFKAKLAFDPPPTSFHLKAIEDQIRELEFRLLILRDEIVDAALVVTQPELPGEPLVTDPVTTNDIHANVDGGGAEVG